LGKIKSRSIEKIIQKNPAIGGVKVVEAEGNDPSSKEPSLKHLQV